MLLRGPSLLEALSPLDDEDGETLFFAKIPSEDNVDAGVTEEITALAVCDTSVIYLCV
jgi:hypothetical protein